LDLAIPDAFWVLLFSFCFEKLILHGAVIMFFNVRTRTFTQPLYNCRISSAFSSKTINKMLFELFLLKMVLGGL